MDENVFNAISSSWRSAVDIGSSVNNAMNRENPKPWLNKQLKLLEESGKVEKMKNRGRAFYRRTMAE